MVSLPEPDILESEVKWALGSTAVNKASGCDIILVELFKIIRMMLSSVAFNMSANLEDPAVAQDWKRSVLIPIPKKGSAKNVLTIG